jgi:FixJ family two-component response regulator
MSEPLRDIVAIVDDNEAVRHLLRFLLEVVGHQVETFALAAEFLKDRLREVCLLDFGPLHATRVRLGARHTAAR